MGLSQVAVPFVSPLARLGSCAEVIIVADMNIMEAAENNSVWRRASERSEERSTIIGALPELLTR